MEATPSYVKPEDVDGSNRRIRGKRVIIDGGPQEGSFSMFFYHDSDNLWRPKIGYRLNGGGGWGGIPSRFGNQYWIVMSPKELYAGLVGTFATYKDCRIDPRSILTFLSGPAMTTEELNKKMVA